MFVGISLFVLVGDLDMIARWLLFLSLLWIMMFGGLVGLVILIVVDVWVCG